MENVQTRTQLLELGPRDKAVEVTHLVVKTY